MFFAKSLVGNRILFVRPFFRFSKEGISNSSANPIYDEYRSFHNIALEKLNIPGVTIVKTLNDANRVLSILNSLKDRDHAWDTETIDLDAKMESPVGRGKIVCASVFCGPDIDFGNGPRLFIDNFGRNSDLINTFKSYLEDPSYKKVWHNYGFDRHIFYNHGINVLGFGGDTMQMARLADSSRGPKGYSLSSLTKSYNKDIEAIKNQWLTVMKRNKQEDRADLFRRCFMGVNIKTDMKKIFARPKILKNGSEGKTFVYPSIIEMHTDEKLINDWVQYSTLDAEITFFLKEVLCLKMKRLQIKYENMNNLLDFYYKYWLDFGEILTDMERNGIRVNIKYLQEIEEKAQSDALKCKNDFIAWVKSTQNHAYIDEFNANSSQQLQQIFFAPFKRLTEEKFKKPKEEEEEKDESEESEDSEEKKIERKSTQTSKIDFEVERTFKVENKINFNLEKTDSKKTKKWVELTIKGLGWPIIDYTLSGLPSCDIEVLKKMVGNREKNEDGTILKFYKDKNEEEKGILARKAVERLIEYRSIETLINTFISPLQTLADKNERIHCSLNLNTETGRLSSRRPNLQNQPALEKDIYKIRKAFQPEPGNKFVVADYGQLELRVLAHITNCKNMLDGFKQGGDFHSRTAISMYTHIKKEVDEGRVLLEWDHSKGKPPVPLIKDKFASERRKAKTMNFSLAYGKSAHGFAKDWNCTLQEANEVLNAWYKDRMEVKYWQENVKRIAQEKGWTQTLMGRYRNLTKYFKNTSLTKKFYQAHGLRAAINTPIQGGAADIVIAAMIKIHKNEQLRNLGWKLLLQIHDELILEGPEASAEEALNIVKQNMSNPLENKLLVDLDVDAKIGNSWLEAK